MKRLLLLLLLSICSIAVSSACSVRCLNQTEHALKPPPIYINDTDRDALVFFSINCSDTSEATFVNVSLSIENRRTIEIRDDFPKEFLLAENFIFNVTVHGKFLGYSNLSLHFDYFDGNRTKVNGTNDLQVKFAVNLSFTVVDKVLSFIGIVPIWIGIVLVGCRLNPQNLGLTIRRPIPILIGLFNQFVSVPLLAFGLAKLAHLDSLTGIGLLATAAASGNVMSCIYTAMYGGDVELALLTTFLGTFLGFVPFLIWVQLLGGNFIDTTNIRWPPTVILKPITLILPIVIGLVIQWRKPAVAQRWAKSLPILTIFLILYILSSVTYRNFYIFHSLDVQTMCVSALVPYLGFLLGFLVSIITRQNREKLITILIESGLQNIGIAATCLALSLPQPDSDLANAVPTFIDIVTPIPLLIIHVGLSIYRRTRPSVTIVSINRDDYEPLPANNSDE